MADARRQLHARETSRCSRASSRFASARRCTSAAPTRTGYHHLLWEIVDNSVDEVINGHATTRRGHARTRTASSVTVDGQRPRHPRRHACRSTRSRRSRSSSPRCTRAASSSSGNYIALGRSARRRRARSSTRSRASSSSRSSATASATSRRSRAARPTSKLKKLGPGARHRHDDHLRARRRDLRREAEVRRGARSRERLEAKSYLHKGLTVVLQRRDGEPAREGDVPARRRHRRVPRQARRRARQGAGAPGQHGLFYRVARRRASRLEVALAWTESTDEHIRSLRQRHPDAQRRHARGGPAQRRWSRRSATTSRRTSSTPKGVTLTAEDIREGIVGDPLHLRARAAVPGPDQGPAQQPRGRGRRSTAWCARRSSSGSTTTRPSPRRSSRASSSPRAPARPVARALSRSSRKTAVSHRLNLPGKLADCSSTDPGRERAVHRRGRLRRRLGQAGPRPPHPGDPAAARQGAQRRAGLDRQGAGQQGAPGHRQRARLRHRRGLRHHASCATAGSSC